MSDPSPPTSRHNNDFDPSNQEGRAVVVRYGIGCVTSEKLLGGLRELEIEHGTERYRLRVTSTGKLILTK